jgi:hypothetical protein
VLEAFAEAGIDALGGGDQRLAGRPAVCDDRSVEALGVELVVERDDVLVGDLRPRAGGEGADGTPVAVRHRLKALVPHQAKAAARAASTRQRDPQLGDRALLDGCSGTAVTDIVDIPGNAKGGDTSPPSREASAGFPAESPWALAGRPAAVALGALALELARPADRRGALAGALLRRLLVMTPSFISR